MFKALKEAFVSLRLSVIILLILILILFAGAYIIPSREEFQSIHSMPLLKWLIENPFHVTWWLWFSIVLLLFLTLNTIFCSVDSILKKRRLTGWLMLISPQVIHIGFLFILLAHLLSSIGGSRNYDIVTEGSIINVGNGDSIRFERIGIDITREGFISDWSVEVIRSSMRGKGFTIRPNSPLFVEGIGIYVRDIQAYPFKAALVEISREPGAVWALLGAILFASGTVTLIILKLRRERQKDEEDRAL